MVHRRYWDSSVFLAWLLPEPDRKRECGEVIHAAEAGDAHIVTSALTLAEVIKLKGNPPLPAAQNEKIRRFFQSEYIKVVNVDRFLAERARALIWDEGLNPKDAIHVATAVRLKLAFLDTYDGGLIDLSGKLGNPPLIIGHPKMPQPELPFSNGGKASAEGGESNEDDEEVPEDDAS